MQAADSLDELHIFGCGVSCRRAVLQQLAERLLGRGGGGVRHGSSRPNTANNGAALRRDACPDAAAEPIEESKLGRGIKFSYTNISTAVDVLRNVPVYRCGYRGVHLNIELSVLYLDL